MRFDVIPAGDRGDAAGQEQTLIEESGVVWKARPLDLRCVQNGKVGARSMPPVLEQSGRMRDWRRHHLAGASGKG